jgi:hypothetical protein
MSEENKYRQLAMFTTIVAEVVVSPCALGGAMYWLLRTHPDLQMIGTSVAALAGLGIAFYRISQLRKRFEQNDS